MITLFNELFRLLFFLIFSAGLATLIFYLSIFLSSKQYDAEKLSAYECGFEPFDDARNAFNVKFYLVAILFIIFDLEVMFLFPWVLSLGVLTLESAFSFWIMIFFLFIL